MAERGEANGEQEGEKVHNDVDPYAYNPNEDQGDEEGIPLGRSLVIQRLLPTPRVDHSDQRNEIFQALCTISKRVCDLIFWLWQWREHCIKQFGYQAVVKYRKASLSVQNKLDQ